MKAPLKAKNMKTSLEELIDKLEHYRNSELEKHIGSSALNYAINVANELKRKEEQMIIDTFEDGKTTMFLINEGKEVKYQYGINYYNKKFNN